MQAKQRDNHQHPAVTILDGMHKSVEQQALSIDWDASRTMTVRLLPPAWRNNQRLRQRPVLICQVAGITLAGCGRNDRGSPSSTLAPLQIRTAFLQSQTIHLIQDVLGQILSAVTRFIS